MTRKSLASARDPAIASRAEAAFRENASGSVAIEFAFVAIVFFMILFGIVSFGLQYAARIGLSYAVAEGGRAALGGLDASERILLATEAVDRVLDSYYPLIDPAKAVVAVQAVGTTSLGTLMEVSVSYSDNRFSALPFIPALSALPPVKTTFLVMDGAS